MLGPAVAEPWHSPLIAWQLINPQTLLMGQHTNPALEGMGQGAIGLSSFRFKVVDPIAESDQRTQQFHSSSEHAAGNEVSAEQINTIHPGAPLKLQ